MEAADYFGGVVMESRFSKPIRDAVTAWARNFNAADLSGKVEQAFRDELAIAVRQATADAEKRVNEAMSKAKEDRDAVQPLREKVAVLEKQLAEERQSNAEKLTFLGKRFEDLEARYAAIMRSSAVGR
jgi:hypothetical protein